METIHFFVLVSVKLIWENSVTATSKNFAQNWISTAARCVCSSRSRGEL